LALARSPSLILLDVRMPEMDGIEVCRRLKQDERARDIPVIFVSALQDTQYRVRGFEVGGVDFISKPFQEADVLARVRPHKSLRNMQLHLEELVVERTAELESEIAERKQAEEAILRYQQRLKALASQLTLAEEQERRRISADLHDNVGHSLALARMQLSGILESESALERKILVKDLSNILLKALQDTRSLIFKLSSPSMNEIGLAAAISEWLEEQVEKRHNLKTELIDDICDGHRKNLDVEKIIEKITTTKTTREWIEILEKNEVVFGH